MATQPARKFWTPEQYLAYDRAAPERHEYLAGDVVAMTGGSRNHSQIQVNLIAALRPMLRPRGCLVFTSDLRVKVPAANLYTYPDVSLVCGEPQFEDQHGDILLNPHTIFEVLSPSTEGYDRGKKFQAYRTLASLQTYVLVAQDEPHVDLYVRTDGLRWTLIESVSLESQLSLPTLECMLSLETIYADVSFTPDA